MIRCTSKVQENRDQLGEQLEAARERLGLTIDDVNFKTRIPRAVLGALEANDFSVFSSPTYAKSFLLQYSSYLEIDASDWLNALESADFSVNGSVNPIWESPKPATVPRFEPRAGSSGRAATLGVMTISAGLIYAAVKGYEYLEQRLGSETKIPVAGERDKTAEKRTIPDELANRTVVAKPLPGEASQPAPRAIIVR